MSRLFLVLSFVFSGTVTDSLLADSINEPLGAKGVQPVGEDGSPLNLNFETGDLTGWTAKGNAWEGQPAQKH